VDDSRRGLSDSGSPREGVGSETSGAQLRGNVSERKPVSSYRIIHSNTTSKTTIAPPFEPRDLEVLRTGHYSTRRRRGIESGVGNATIVFEEEMGTIPGAERREGRRCAGAQRGTRASVSAVPIRLCRIDLLPLQSKGAVLRGRGWRLVLSWPTNDDANSSVSERAPICSTHQRGDDNARKSGLESTCGMQTSSRRVGGMAPRSGP
jgi:hypothetical protein